MDTNVILGNPVRIGIADSNFTLPNIDYEGTLYNQLVLVLLDTENNVTRFPGTNPVQVRISSQARDVSATVPQLTGTVVHNFNSEKCVCDKLMVCIHVVYGYTNRIR